MRSKIIIFSVLCFVVPTAPAELPDNDIRGLEARHTKQKPASPNDIAQTINKLRESALEGNAAAQYRLGIHFTQSRDYNNAYKWFHKAAEQGYTKAHYMIGLSYSLGRGVPQNQEVALEWFPKAAKR